MTLGNIERVEEFINKIICDNNQYLTIIPILMKKIIIKFGSWTKFLNYFDMYNGNFEDLSFIY
jgi:hypothetical protein